MHDLHEQQERLRTEMQKLRERYELSRTVGPDYFEPGMMEYLDQSYGSFEESTGKMLLRFEVRGTRYEGRTERIERVQTGDTLRILRDPDNRYNPNNFMIYSSQGHDLGNMPATLCDALAPLYDAGVVVLQYARVSYVEPISRRSRHAKQAILFAELMLQLR